MAARQRRTTGVLIALAILASSSALFLSAQALQQVGTWAPSGAIADGRTGAASVTLGDGTTLIVGGIVDGAASDSVLRYDPATGGLVTAGQLLSVRAGHTATLLEDGRVLIAGGRAGGVPSADIEVFDPDAGTSTVLGQLSQPRIGPASARIADGLVVIFGGATADGVVLDTVERIDVATGSVTAGANRMLRARAHASATALIDGRVLVAGGNDGATDLASAEFYFPWTQAFEPTANELSVPRSGHAAVLLPHNGGVLVAGGNSNGVAQATVDLLLPAESPDPFSFGVNTFAATGPMGAARAGATGGAGREGYVWVDGGGSSDPESYRFATIKTDKDDYAPGERALITGSGWMPGEHVRLLFQEDPAVHADYELTVTADAAGNIYWDQWAPEEHDLGVRFYLLASDSRSRAQITFTDHAPHGTHSFNFATVGLGVPISITISGSRNIPGSGHAFTPYTVTFPSPGPSGSFGAAISIVGGTNALASTLTFGGFPTSVPAPGGTYNLVSTTHASPISVPTITGSTTVTATYQFVPSNAAPVITEGASASVEMSEDGSPTPFSLTLNATDVDGNTLTWSISTPASQGTASVSGTGLSKSIGYVPASNYYGSDSFVVQVSDGNGGTDTITVGVTIGAVNDAPSFVSGGNVTVNEDSAAYNQVWATAISAGPANESGQTVSFVVSNDNNALFTVQPAVSATGVLTFTPAADAFGTATVTIYAQDSGGTANGGDDTSDSQTFTITVTAVNDAPSFTSGGDVTVNEDSAATSQSWATAISAGPANESSQTVSFVVSNNNPSLFSVQPAVSPAGVLTFTPAPDAFGTATVTVYARDSGGTSNGGDDTSDSQTFTITVNAVNDAPSFVSGGNVTVNEDSGAYSAGGATAISAGPANESTQTVSFFVSNTNPSLFSAQPAVSPAGILTFTPALNAFGSATVTIYAQDDGGTSNGGDDTSDSQTFTITVNAVNDAPVVALTLSNPGPIDENGSTTLNGSFTDPDVGDSHLVMIAWGDGSVTTLPALAAGVFTFSAAHTYLDDNPTGTPFDVNSIVVTVTDDAFTTGSVGALSGTAGGTIRVNNVLPVIASLSEPGAPIQLGASASITATFTDVGTVDTHSCTFDWDDGTTSAPPSGTGTVVVDQATDSCTGTKQYSAAGVYTVRVTVTDDDTGEASAYYKYVVVYDPNAGFVTGGGWLISPVNPTMQYMTESGRANFGFVSKYQKGAKVPTGETQFQFQAGNLNFHSISYDWLVIAGAKAQYKGVGRINNALAPNGMPYKFLLTATDGQVSGGGGTDKFRIKIWWEDGASVTVVYDNSPSSDDIDQTVTQAIGGGSIVIHSK